MPKLKIEMYQEKSAASCDWMKETQTEKPLEWTKDRKQEKKVEHETRRCEDRLKITALTLSEIHEGFPHRQQRIIPRPMFASLVL